MIYTRDGIMAMDECPEAEDYDDGLWENADDVFFFEEEE